MFSERTYYLVPRFVVLRRGGLTRTEVEGLKTRCLPSSDFGAGPLNGDSGMMEIFGLS